MLKGVGQNLETADKERVLEIIPKLQSSEDQIVGVIFYRTMSLGTPEYFANS